MKNDVRDYDWQLRLLELLLTIWEGMCMEQVWGKEVGRGCDCNKAQILKEVIK